MSKQRIALVTGGMGSIGTAISQRLAKDGFIVVVGCTPQTPRAATAGWPSSATWASTSTPANTTSPTGKAPAPPSPSNPREQLGRSTCWSTTPAPITRDASFRKMTPENWHAVIDTNLTGLFNATKQVVEDMLAQGWGRIINISSVNGQRGQFGQTNYSAARPASTASPWPWPSEVAGKGVTVNTLSGYIETDMTAVIRPEILENIVAGIPAAGRLGKPPRSPR